MSRRRLPIVLPAVIFISVGAAAQQPAAQSTVASRASYAVTDLGTLGGAVTKAMGINDTGDVAGAGQSGTYMYAVSWVDGTMTNLGDLGGQGSWAYDVNDAGQVVGGSPLGSGDNHAFVWQNGSMQDLGTLGGPSSYAFEINGSGQAVGYACCAPDTYLSHAVLWGSGGIVDLGDLDPQWPAISAAYGVNDAGQVVGGSYDASANFHAFLWQGGAMQDLGTLGGDYSAAEAVNENGQVVGTARLANGSPYAFLWDGAMQDLGSLGWDSSIAYDINDDGIVVGALQSGATSHAFLWADGQMVDLNTLIPAGSGWVLNEARAINNQGRIVGFGLVGGQTRAFLLKPAFRWTNPAGGSWYLSSNWDPPGVPGPGDTVIFGLSGQYSVDTTPVLGDAPTTGTEADQILVESTNTVDFHSLALNLLGDSPTDPGLKVGDGEIVNIHSGSGQFVHGAIGVLPPANPSNPPTARLQVFNSGTTLAGTGGLLIGDEGPGDLFVANGGHLTSAEARLGGVLQEGLGTAVVGGDGSLWETGNLAVGYGVKGELEIENGGRVNSNDSYVSWGMLSHDSGVWVHGVGSGSQSSTWSVLGSLTVGQNNPGGSTCPAVPTWT
jgi:probable HAF family extracellular repeat protein/T5SS/PEP-CTERM-associated repeat protein